MQLQRLLVKLFIEQLSTVQCKALVILCVCVCVCVRVRACMRVCVVTVKYTGQQQVFLFGLCVKFGSARRCLRQFHYNFSGNIVPSIRHP
jgi:hypothetical protein